MLRKNNCKPRENPVQQLGALDPTTTSILHQATHNIATTNIAILLITATTMITYLDRLLRTPQSVGTNEYQNDLRPSKRRQKNHLDLIIHWNFQQQPQKIQWKALKPAAGEISNSKHTHTQTHTHTANKKPRASQHHTNCTKSGLRKMVSR
jgi:hypothetical protein